MWITSGGVEFTFRRRMLHRNSQIVNDLIRGLDFVAFIRKRFKMGSGLSKNRTPIFKFVNAFALGFWPEFEVEFHLTVRTTILHHFFHWWRSCLWYILIHWCWRKRKLPPIILRWSQSDGDFLKNLRSRKDYKMMYVGENALINIFWFPLFF